MTAGVRPATAVCLPPPPTHTPPPPPPRQTPALPPPAGELGDKKRRKTLAALRESDVAIIVVDCARHRGLSNARLRDSLHWEQELLRVRWGWRTAVCLTDGLHWQQ